MANKPLITRKEVRRKLIETRRLGMSQAQSCKVAGITEQTLRNTLKRGRLPEEKDTVYGKFLIDYESAVDVGTAEDLKEIKKAGERDWKARAWRLERIHPRQFGRPEIQIAINEKEKDEKSKGKASSQVVIYLPDNGRD